MKKVPFKRGLYTFDETNEAPKITMVIPISRMWPLDRLFESLANLNIPYSDVGLLFYIDTDHERLIEKVIREKIPALYKKSDIGMTGFLKVYVARNEIIPEQRNYKERRKRVAQIHNTCKQFIKGEFVMGIEDDTIVPRETFWRLYRAILELNKVGFVTGCEVGRWGMKHIGGWKFLDRMGNDISALQSVPYQKGVIDLDAGGLYCFMARSDLYKAHDFAAHEKYEFIGPDMAFGKYVRDQGFRCLMDMDIVCHHLSRNEADGTVETLSPLDRDVVVLRFRRNASWLTEYYNPKTQGDFYGGVPQSHVHTS